MKKIKQLLLVLMLTLSLATPATVPVIGTATPVSATARTSISNKSITLYKGKSKQLKIKGTSKKVKWSSKNRLHALAFRVMYGSPLPEAAITEFPIADA